jgi:hypothetical protein
MGTTVRDLNWYLKWVATAILIVGTAVNSAGFYPEGPILLTVGGIFWLIVSIRWKEISLIITNAVMLATGIIGLLWKYLA